MQSNTQESYAARYDNLCREAIKFVGEVTESIHTFHVAIDALHEAAKKVASVKEHDTAVIDYFPYNSGQQVQSGSEEDQEKKIEELSVELEDASRRCEEYRAKLVDILKDMEEQKLKMRVKVQNVRLIVKD